MEERLWRIFQNINYWLQYAERKNALILTFIGIQITLIKIFIKTLDAWLVASFVFLGFCFLLAIFSFLPRTRISRWWFDFMIKPSNEAGENDNLLFYGHVAKYTVKEYTEKIEKYLNGTIHGHRNLEDLCSQIVVNSQITSAKFNFFKITVWLMMIGQFLLLVSLWS